MIDEPSQIERTAQALSSGALTFRDFGGLGREDIDNIENLALAAFTSGRFDQADRIYEVLETLEADRMTHTLRRAFVQWKKQDTEAALRMLRKFFEQVDRATVAEETEALLLHSVLIRAKAPRVADWDLRRVAELISVDPEASQVATSWGLPTEAA
jgi:hypothetical protein